MAKPIDAQAMQRAIAVHRELEQEVMAPQTMRQNLVGFGVGEKVSGGRPTGEPALMALVTHKVDADLLADADRVPERFGDMQTDVLEVGFPVALAAPPRGGRAAEPYTPYSQYRQLSDYQPALVPMPPADPRDSGYVRVPVTDLEPMMASPQLLARRVRPAEGGYSVGHFGITAGTIATCVYDILPGGGTNPPTHGIGVPPRFYILSNNHVLANSNAAAPGDPILQPGPIDGGTFPLDRIAALSRFIPITFEPPVPRALHRNLVDAAVAEVAFHDADRELHWIGNVRGWRRRANVTVGTLVKKVGRTTNLTLGRITAVNVTIDVGFGVGVARFQDQIVTTNISAGGDSGSLVVTHDNVALGLLFAGSPVATILNQIEHVRALLRIEVAEQIL